VGDVVAGSTPDPDKPVLKDGTFQQNKQGGMPQANSDFDSLNPQNVVDQGGDVRTGTLPDGTRVAVRTKSTPSLDINPPPGSSAPDYVIRY
jgi:hypothetical protein